MSWCKNHEDRHFSLVGKSNLHANNYEDKIIKSLRKVNISSNQENLNITQVWKVQTFEPQGFKDHFELPCGP